jgi:hypothetical protein
MVDNARSQAWLERFQAKWKPVRVKKTRQIKKLEPRFDSIETEKALANTYDSARVDHGSIELSRIMIYPRGT